jgi:hypothetical protein
MEQWAEIGTYHAALPAAEWSGLAHLLILKEQWVLRYRFERQKNAIRVIGEMIRFYNTLRPYQPLGMKTPEHA